MALTKISTAMISQSAAAVDLNVDAGTFYVDTTNNRVGVGGKTDPDTPLHVIGTATATTFAGSGASLTDIPNSALVNSSITINSTAVSLGGSLTLTTANIAENTNLYYTDARADARADARIAAADTDDLSEGSSNLYYTDARVDARVSGGSLGNITTTGYIRGPATFTLDPAAHGDDTGTVVIAGNLQVDGTTTTINSTTLTVDDKNITLASGSVNAAAADGAGFTVDIGTGTLPAITYDGTNDEWDFNKDINVTGNIAVSGTISSGAITSTGTILTDGTASNSVPKYSFSGDTDTGLGYVGTNTVGLIAGGSRKFYVNATNAFFQNLTGGVSVPLLSIGSTTVIDSNRNLTNIGTISSGAITTTGALNVDEYIYHAGDTDTYARFITDRLMLSSGGGAFIDLHSNGQLYLTGQANFYNTINIADDVLQMGSTTVIDSNRNLTNIGTISSGAITSSSTIRANSWYRGGSDTNTLYSDTSQGTIIQTPSNTNNAAGTFYVRDSLGTVHFSLNTNTNAASFHGGTISSGAITATAGIYSNSIKGLSTTSFTQGTAGSRKLGTFFCGQAGQTILITYIGGAGYNADNAQNGRIYIHFRTSNNSSNQAAQDSSAFYASGHWWHEGRGTIASAVQVKQVSATQYEFYITGASFAGNGSVTAKCDHGSRWESTMQDSTLSGTYLTLPEEKIFKTGVSVTGNVGIGQSSFGVNGKLQVTGGIGLTGNSEIRQSTNSDGSTLRFLGTQLVISNSNANGYSYSGGGLVASVAPSAGAIMIDAGAVNTSGHRLKVINGGDGIQGSLQYLSGTTSRFYVDSSSGKVGIGTASPDAKLHISGTGGDNAELLRITSDGDVGDAGYHWMSSAIAGSQSTNASMIHLIGVAENTKNSGYFGFHYAGAGSNDNYLKFGGYAADNLMVIKMNGNVGIGTTAPGWQFVVQGAGTGSGLQDGHVMIRSTTAANPAGLMFINSGNTASYNDLGSIQGIIESGNAKGALRFITRNSDGNNTGVAERMRITSAGNVIVGTTSSTYPKGKFTIHATPGVPATSGTSTTNVGFRLGTTTGNSQVLDMGVYNAAPYGSWIQTSGAGEMSATSPLVLNPNGGNVGIGTDSPDRALEVSTDGTAQLRLSRVDSTINGNNNIGSIEFMGTDDTAGTVGATIMAASSTTWGGGNYPTDLRFSTMSGSTLSEQMRLGAGVSTGNMALGLTNVVGVNSEAAIHGKSSDATLVLTNTDLSNSTTWGWTGRSDRVLTSNGSTWTNDGKDPALVIGSNIGTTQRGGGLGILLHNESNVNSNFSPGLYFSTRSESTVYNTAYGYIMGKKTGSGVDTNWSTGEIHMDTAGVRTGTATRTAYMDGIPAFKIDNAGDISMPYKAYAYGIISGNPTSITNNYGIAISTTRHQNCTPTTNAGHGPGITITKAGFYILNMSVLYGPTGDYVYLGWCVNGTQIHHWHSNHTVENHDAVSQIGRYLNIGDHVSIENSSQSISNIYGNSHSSWYIAKIG